MKDSRIVELFAKDSVGLEVDQNDLYKGNEYMRSLAGKADPTSLFELGEIMRHTINEGVTRKTNYLDEVADVRRTALGETAQFEIELDDLHAQTQAHSGTTKASQISKRFQTIENEEVSIRPKVNFYDLKTGRTDFSRLVERAQEEMSVEIARLVQSKFAKAYEDSGVLYAAGGGIVKGNIDPLITTMRRIGGSPAIFGDPEALLGFTEATGFDGRVPDDLVIELHQNGIIGKYLGSYLTQLQNPLQRRSFETELRKDLIYIIPALAEELRPLKVHFEGGIEQFQNTNIDSKAHEFRFDQLVGAEIIGDRKLMAVYQDTELTDK